MISNWHTWEILTNWCGRFTMYDEYHYLIRFTMIIYPDPETRSSPLKNGWVEDDPFLLGRPIFRGELLVYDHLLYAMNFDSLTHPENHPSENLATQNHNMMWACSWVSSVFRVTPTGQNYGIFGMFFWLPVFFCENLCRGLKSYAVFVG